MPRDTYGEDAETGVVALAMLGNDAAFSELVRRRQAAIRGLMRRLCGEGALADDLAQQVFLQAWRMIRTLRSPAAFGGWLRQIGVNIWMQYLRSRRLPNDAESADNLSWDTEPSVTARIDLDRALGALKPNERLCVVLSYAEGMSHSEIVAATGWPLGTVKSHITRGTTQLRSLLQSYGKVP